MYRKIRESCATQPWLVGVSDGRPYGKCTVVVIPRANSYADAISQARFDEQVVRLFPEWEGGEYHRLGADDNRHIMVIPV